METEKRINGNGRREHDQYCAMHASVVNTQQEIKTGFRWLIALHIGEYGIIISALMAVVIFLIKK